MAGTISPPRELVDALKETLYPARPAEEFDYPGCVRDLARGRIQSPGGAEDEAAFAEAAVHFYNICTAKRGEVALKAALTGLLQLGRPGWLFFRRLVLRQTVPTETCTTLLESLPASCGLGVLQELFRPPSPPDKASLPWAEPLLDALSQAEVPELLRFVARVDAQRDRVSHSLREALLNGPLKAWIESRLSARLSPEIFSNLCACARALSLSDVAARMAEHLARGQATPSPEVVRAIIDATAPGDARAITALQALIKTSGTANALTCVAGLARLHWGNAGKLAALLQTKSPALARALPLVAAQFPERAYRQYLNALNDAERQRAANEVFRAAARLQPSFATARIKAAPELPAEVRQELKKLLTAEKRAGLAGLRLKTPPEPRDEPFRPEENKRFFARLLPDRKASLAELLEQSRNPRDKALPGCELRETALTGRSLANMDLSGGLFQKVQFIRTTFSGVDFSGATLREADFTGCTFNNCRFRGARLHKTALTACTISRCDFSGAIFTDSVAEDGDIERSVFTDCLLLNMRLERITLRCCALGRCQFRNGQARALLFQTTTLTGNLWINSRLFGLRWRDCTLMHETFLSARFQSSEAIDTCAAYCRVIGGATGVGLLDALEIKRQERECERLAALALETKPAGLSPSLAPFMQRGADLWVRHRDLAQRESNMRMSNQRRLRWAEAAMPAPQFLTLIPYLLSSQVFERAHNLTGTPNCRIAGYVPGVEALELAEEYFPGLRSSSPAGEALVIETLATIGSVGSVAQTRESDADFWVCYDAATAPPEAEKGLKAKLDAIERWAGQTFGLEAHFFLMSLENVQNNEFGFSDKESSGTAQALMLKEEFYRTALILAGRVPGWWLTPPGGEEKAYRACLRSAVADPLADPGRFMDAGHASRIPSDEFFGAALWQIVKSIDSPFKSVLKLGLLEKYARDGGRSLLLCDQIKKSATLGAKGARRTDPYAAMAVLVRDHYRATGDRDAVRLITESLALKTDVAGIPRVLGRPCNAEHQALLALLFGGDGNTLPTSGRAERSFARALALGEAVSGFMTNAYKRIHATPLSGTSPASIAPEDLTRLGRRISAIFAKRRNKVRRVPILGIGRGDFAELRFSADKKPGKPTQWLVHGKAGQRGVTTSRKSEILSAAADPARLLTWLVVNGLYTPSALVDAERSIAPLATPDLRNILDELTEFMPPAQIFRVNPDEYLRDEHITRVYLIPNLLAAPDVDKLTSLSVVYCTNWGEVFCFAPPSPAAALKLGTLAYLKNVLPQDQPAPPEIKAYYPKRSQCPRLKLA